MALLLLPLETDGMTERERGREGVSLPMECHLAVSIIFQKIRRGRHAQRVFLENIFAFCSNCMNNPRWYVAERVSVSGRPVWKQFGLQTIFTYSGITLPGVSSPGSESKGSILLLYGQQM